MQSDKTDKLGRLLDISSRSTRVLPQSSFQDHSVPVGTEFFIDVKVAGKVVKVKTQLIGYLDGQYLIVTTPKINGQNIRYGDHQTLVVRYLMHGSIYGFQTSVLRVLGPPFSLTFLKCPDRIEEFSLRRAPRIQVMIPFEREGGDPEKEWITNLSEGGALLQMGSAPDLGDEFTISFNLPNGQQVKDLLVTTKRAEISTERAMVGVAFVSQPEKKQVILDYLQMLVNSMGDSSQP